MEIDGRGNVLHSRFAEGVLRSRERMTYTSVARILVERDAAELKRCAELVPMFEAMEELCQRASRARFTTSAS